MAQTLYERVGGFAAVRRIVSAFYDAVLDEPRLAAHFADVEVARLIDHQTKFIASLMGGPAAFSDEQLRRVHAHLAVTRGEFDLLTELLADVLENAGLDRADVDHVVGEMERRAPQIVK
ncbi:MAG: group 1 truncated hemoglobin [Sphingomonadaceae bacterium]